jgi:hypothetical protein
MTPSTSWTGDGPPTHLEAAAMQYDPHSNYGSKASLPTYYIPGGFCLPGQSRLPDYDVVPDLSTCSGMESPRNSTSRIVAFLRAGGGFIGKLIATLRNRETAASRAR